MLERLSRLFAPRAQSAAAEDAPTDGGTAEDWKNRGNTHFANREFDLAADCYRHAIAADPAYAEAYNNLGLVKLRLGEDDAAMALFREAIELKPGLAQAHRAYGDALHARGRFDEAADCYRTAIARNPALPEAHYRLGDLLLEVGRADEARPCFEEAIRLRPDFTEAHNDLGLALKDMAQPESALACFERALASNPNFPPAHANLGALLLGDFDRPADALGHLTQAIRLASEDANARFNLARALLACGRLAEAWPEYRQRFFVSGGRAAPRIWTVPEWTGEDLGGNTIVVWGDQGVGDEILFANLLPDIVACARRCVIECVHKLVPLFARSFPGAVVVPKTEPPHPATRNGVDFQIAAADAARWLRPTHDSFPRHDGYLTPDPVRVAHWRTRFAALGPGLKVGFSWRSHLVSGIRNLHYTRLDQWGPIFAVPGVHFVNLQYDRCAEELDEARRRFNVPLHSFDEVDLFDDLAEAAALKQALDLVISAPTSTAFLSAAVGTSTWMTSYATPWHTLGTDHVPWFPSMRCFPRRWNQDWNEIIADIAHNLAARIA